jgi:hypothetical protein
MADDRLHTELREALAGASPHPSLRPRVIAAMAAGAGADRRQRTAGLAAAGLAAALVAGLLAARVLLRPPPPPPVSVPAGTVAGTATVTSGIDIHCTLPIQVGGAVATVDLPSGTVTRYPAPPGSNRAAAYANGRWAPVPPSGVAPAGRSYAYVVNATAAPGHPPAAALHVRDLLTGADRVVWRGDGWADVAGWTDAGVFVVQEPRGLGVGLTNMLVIDPGSGTARRVGPNPALPAGAATGRLPLFIDSHWIGADAAWTAFGSRPTVVGAETGHDTVERMDLRTGRLAAWFVAPLGMEVEVIGIDVQGHPVLTVAPVATRAAPNPPVQVLLLTAPNQTVAISAGEQQTLRPTGAFGDREGVWIGDQGALWLYRGGVLLKVADVPAGLLDAVTAVRVSGACR